MLHNQAMSSELLPAISAFTRVAHHASFTRAAAELNVSPSALSQTIRVLENKLGARLLDRTTRRVGVTEIGRLFLAEAQVGLRALEGAIAGLNETRDEPAGVLRLNVSSAAARITLLSRLAAFSDLHPKIVLDIQCDNGLVDLIAGGFDAGIRLGELLAQDMVAVPLGPRQRLATFASPGYLRSRTPPRTPADLKHHRCLNGRVSGDNPYRWEYARKGAIIQVDTPNSLLCNDDGFLIDVARTGNGIGCTFEAAVQADFDAGRLVPLLKPWWPTFDSFYLYYTSRTHMPRKLRAFVDFMQTHEPRKQPG